MALFSGVAQIASNPMSETPIIAPAAQWRCDGRYLVMFPHSRVILAVPIFSSSTSGKPRSGIFLIWFLIQFFSGAMGLSGGESLGIAQWAHIGVCRWHDCGSVLPASPNQERLRSLRFHGISREYSKIRMA